MTTTTTDPLLETETQVQNKLIFFLLLRPPSPQPPPLGYPSRRNTPPLRALPPMDLHLPYARLCTCLCIFSAFACFCHTTYDWGFIERAPVVASCIACFPEMRA